MNNTALLVAVTILLFALIIIPTILKFFRQCPAKAYRWPLKISFKNLKIKAEIMEFQLHEDEVLPFKVGNPINSDGEEAPIEEGSLKIASSDESIFTIEQDDEQPDDPDAKMIVPHAEGSAELTITADADLGSGVVEISLTVTGTIISGAAVGFGPVTFGQPRKKKPTL